VKRFIVVLLSAIVLITGCNKSAATPQTKEGAPRAAAAPGNPLEINATPALLERIKIGQPSYANVGASMTVAGRVEVDETRVTRVGSPVMGRINALAVREGMEVRKGQLLALLNSTGLSEAQLGLIKAVSQKELARRAVERAQILIKAEVIGSAELQRREAELAQASAELEAAKDQLVLLGMTEDAVEVLEKTRTINSVSRVVASMDGTVLDRKITIGQVVQPADTVFEIADLSYVWLVADVPEQTAGTLADGHNVEAEILAFPGKMIRGKLSFVSSTVNPETRTVRVRMDLPNPERRYKPAMLATMVLKDQLERKQVVPTTAVVREENVEHVFIQVDADTFVLRPVVLGDEFGGHRVLIEGVRPGEKIVVDGAFHLNNERRRLALRGSEG
jgi:membrane fusion protein, heavy metal efflux system